MTIRKAILTKSIAAFLCTLLPITAVSATRVVNPFQITDVRDFPDGEALTKQITSGLGLSYGKDTYLLAADGKYVFPGVHMFSLKDSVIKSKSSYSNVLEVKYGKGMKLERDDGITAGLLSLSFRYFYYNSFQDWYVQLPTHHYWTVISILTFKKFIPSGFTGGAGLNVFVPFIARYKGFSFDFYMGKTDFVFNGFSAYFKLGAYLTFGNGLQDFEVMQLGEAEIDKLLVPVFAMIEYSPVSSFKIGARIGTSFSRVLTRIYANDNIALQKRWKMGREPVMAGLMLSYSPD